MLDERKASILRAVVQEYIETAQPVGSGRVAEAPGVEVSSATVRNEMALLETHGYLVQPHASAGRIPTEKGYRYFVDTIGAPGALRGENARRVKDFFTRAHGELETMLEETSRLLSGLTAWTGVVVGPTPVDAVVRSLQVVGLSPTSALVVVVMADASVEKHQIELDRAMGDERLAAATAHLGAHLTGCTRAGLPASVQPTGDADVDDICRGVLSTLARVEARDVSGEAFVSGASRVASAFEAVETVQRVLGVLEEQMVVVTLLRDVVDRGLQVAIGSETGMEPLADAALVVAPYSVDGKRAGSIAVLGPARMNYPEALAAVAAVSRRLGSHLAEG